MCTLTFFLLKKLNCTMIYVNTEHVRLKNLTVDYVHIARTLNFPVIFSLHNSHLPQYIFSRFHLKHLFRRLDYQNKERRRLNPHLFSKRDSSSIIIVPEHWGLFNIEDWRELQGFPPPLLMCLLVTCIINPSNQPLT